MRLKKAYNDTQVEDVYPKLAILRAEYPELKYSVFKRIVTQTSLDLPAKLEKFI